MPDLTTSLAGIRFKSPVLVASSECGCDPDFVDLLARQPVGGIVTKTFTSKPEHKVRVRPYQFPLSRLGRGYRSGDCLYSLAAPHVEDLEAWLRKVGQMTKTCARHGVVLIASFFEDPADMSLWVDRAKAFEETGAQMLELNFSCPHTAKVFAGNMSISCDILEAVKGAVSVPVGLKIGPTLEPLDSVTKDWEGAGADFLTAHNAPAGLVIDVEQEMPFGAPAACGYAMGRAFLPFSLGRTVRIMRAVGIPVIGVGGIGEPQDVLQYLLCGTRLTGIGSSLYFHGPDMLGRIHDGICRWMERKGYGSVDAFRGKVFPLIEEPATLGGREKYPFTVPPDGPYVPVVDPDRCNLCGRCVRSCIYGVFRQEDGIVVDESRCWSCGFCVGICRERAIELRDRADPDLVIWKNEGLAEPFKIQERSGSKP